MWTKDIQRMVLSIFLLMGTCSVIACEKGALTIRPMTTQPTYDVFNTSSFATINTYKISAELFGDDCHLDVILQLDDTSRVLKSAQNETLEFQWSGQNGTDLANQWHFSLTQQQPTATVQMRFPGKQWVNAGVYEGLLELSLKGGSTSELIEVSPLRLRTQVNVPPAAKVHYYGTAQQHYDLVLGELYSNKVIHSSPKLWVQSNTAYRVLLSSMHKGALRHESNDAQWDIPYQLTLDNETVDLKQVDAYIKRHGATFGLPIAMNFVIGDTSNKPGGQYADTLEISIEPLLSQPPNF